MTGPDALWLSLAALLAGTAVAGGLQLLLKLGYSSGTAGLSSRGLPWWTRLCWWPVLWLAPALVAIIPARLHQRTERDLARCDVDGEIYS